MNNNIPQDKHKVLNAPDFDESNLIFVEKLKQ